MSRASNMKILLFILLMCNVGWSYRIGDDVKIKDADISYIADSSGNPTDIGFTIMGTALYKTYFGTCSICSLDIWVEHDEMTIITSNCNIGGKNVHETCFDLFWSWLMSEYKDRDKNDIKVELPSKYDTYIAIPYWLDFEVGKSSVSITAINVEYINKIDGLYRIFRYSMSNFDCFILKIDTTPAIIEVPATKEERERKEK